MQTPSKPTRTVTREEQPDYDEVDPVYEEEPQAHYDEGAQLEYRDDFTDADADDGGSQEWRLRSQK